MITSADSRRPRVRMSAAQRREQLIDIARPLFAVKGYDGTSVEEIAATAGVSKPVVYEHFGGKEGLHAVVVDRESQLLADALRDALTTPGAGALQLIEQATMALLDYVEAHSDGFRILARDSGPGRPTATFATIIGAVAAQAEDILADEFAARALDPATAPLYAQALVGTVASTSQWWLDERTLTKEQVAAHLVNLIWRGLRELTPSPQLRTVREPAPTPRRARR